MPLGLLRSVTHASTILDSSPTIHAWLDPTAGIPGILGSSLSAVAGGRTRLSPVQSVRLRKFGLAISHRLPFPKTREIKLLSSIKLSGLGQRVHKDQKLKPAPRVTLLWNISDAKTLQHAYQFVVISIEPGTQFSPFRVFNQ